ncbi:epsin-1-like [Pollicipes pollicipes]|uniref:epsin-1-like n=1 Tax=Pollicipes pollicipes TaxID=41117 RepID=UPI0018854EB9|nr:epsin-1-like [Pollicipes pollicipes]
MNAGAVRQVRRNVRNVVHNYTDAQVKVREATSNDPWGPSSTLMSQIAEYSHNMVAFTDIMQMIWRRLNDHGKNWRHVYKALVLMDYLIKTGSERVAQQCKENIFAIETLKDFQHFEENTDHGRAIRERAKQLVTLLQDEEKLKQERQRAIKARERFLESSQGLAGLDRPRDHSPGPMSPTERPVDVTRPAAPDLEMARPQTSGEEELQLQLAIAMSQEEAERERQRSRSDEVRLQMALKESEHDVAPASAAGAGGLRRPPGERPSAMTDLLSLDLGGGAAAATATAPAAAAAPAAVVADPWGLPAPAPAKPQVSQLVTPGTGRVSLRRGVPSWASCWDMSPLTCCFAHMPPRWIGVWPLSGVRSWMGVVSERLWAVLLPACCRTCSLGVLVARSALPAAAESPPTNRTLGAVRWSWAAAAAAPASIDPWGMPVQPAAPAPKQAAQNDPWSGVSTPVAAADPWSPLDRPPWAPLAAAGPASPAASDPWAPLHSQQPTSPPSDEDEFAELTQRSGGATNGARGASSSPWDMTGLGVTLTPSPVGGASAAAPAPAKPPTSKSPHSFLGENSGLVNLDNLIGAPAPQPAPAAQANPFGWTPSGAVAMANPFQAQNPPPPSINQIRDRRFEPAQSTNPWTSPASAANPFLS